MAKKPEGKKESARKQIGVKLDVDLWHEIKVLAVVTHRTAGALLEEALREYLEKHRRGRK